MTTIKRRALAADQKLPKECGFDQLLVERSQGVTPQITRGQLAGGFRGRAHFGPYALAADLFERFGWADCDAGPSKPLAEQALIALYEGRRCRSFCAIPV
jgi:hypothetical protein